MSTALRNKNSAPKTFREKAGVVAASVGLTAAALGFGLGLTEHTFAKNDEVAAKLANPPDSWDGDEVKATQLEASSVAHSEDAVLDMEVAVAGLLVAIAGVAATKPPEDR